MNAKNCCGKQSLFCLTLKWLGLFWTAGKRLRRVIKLKYDNTHIKIHKDKYGKRLVEIQNNVEGETYGVRPDGTHWQKVLAMREVKLPYKVGDILYVWETWRIWKAHRYDADAFIDFRSGGYGTILRFTHGCTDLADRDDYDRFIRKWGVDGKWHPSIHMPKEAARIFLRVTHVRVERLQDITEAQATAEGIFLDSPNFIPTYHYSKDKCDIPGKGWNTARECFQRGLWDSTIKKSDIDKYGWAANPFVWVIEFERID